MLGAALVVLAAPLGLRFLSSVIVRPETWVAVAGLAAELWHNVPRAELHRMETLVEARQASLVVVSVDQTKQEVETAARTGDGPHRRRRVSRQEGW